MRIGEVNVTYYSTVCVRYSTVLYLTLSSNALSFNAGVFSALRTLIVNPPPVFPLRGIMQKKCVSE